MKYDYKQSQAFFYIYIYIFFFFHFTFKREHKFGSDVLYEFLFLKARRLFYDFGRNFKITGRIRIYLYTLRFAPCATS